MLRAASLIAVALFCTQFLLADQITLSNGDRLTGTITKADGKTLVIKTEFAGEVTVQWPAITEINSEQALHVALKNGQTVVGPVKSSDGNLDVTPANAQPVAVAKDAVLSVRNPGEEAAYEKALHPGLMQGWVGGANVGFALTGGNSETENLAIAFTADRKTQNDHIGLYENSVFAKNNAPGSTPSTTAQATQGGARYDRNFDSQLFGFGSTDFQTDALQSLDLRSVFSGGIGWHAINNARTTLDFLGGANYTRENYSTLQRNIAAITAGEELMHKLGKSTVIIQKLYAFPDLSQTGEYRAAFNLGTVTKLSKWLGWQNAFGDIYVTNPPVGKKTNDLQLTTGLNISFTH